MEIFYSIDRVRRWAGSRPIGLTFGVFDGIHLGHQALVRSVVRWARSRRAVAVVLTFRDHPLRLLAPVYCPRILSPLPTKLALLKQQGVDATVVVEFDRQFAALEPEGFVQEILVGRLGVSAVFMGFNNRFGRGGAGTPEDLKRFGATMGFEVLIQPPQLWHDAVISSTRVRQLLIDGEVHVAAQLLGRPYSVAGVVGPGHGRGRALGFPTANLKVPSEILIPRAGVYAIRADHAGLTYQGMMNVGISPTFNRGDLALEAHLFDFSGDLMGRELAVHFIERLRDERRFASSEALRAQLLRDEIQARKILQK